MNLKVLSYTIKTKFLLKDYFFVILTTSEDIKTKLMPDLYTLSVNPLSISY